MRHTRLVLAGAVMVLLSSVSAIAYFQDVDCDLRFMGSARKAVKLRSAADGDNYTSLNGGRSVSVGQLLDFTCGLDNQVPSRIPSTRPMQDLETVKVNLKGFLLGVRFEKSHRQGDGKDNDFHVEIGGENRWETPHVVVEVPPGQNYCDARTAIANMMQKDADASGQRVSNVYIFNDPPLVSVKGYIFLDSAHGSTDFCHSNGGRGIHRASAASQVQGLWEIHPVLSVESAR